jgi:Zn finger protein HypA/HybF involved in hydrogenase expression
MIRKIIKCHKRVFLAEVYISEIVLFEIIDKGLLAMKLFDRIKLNSYYIKKKITDKGKIFCLKCGFEWFSYNRENICPKCSGKNNYIKKRCPKCNYSVYFKKGTHKCPDCKNKLEKVQAERLW